MRAIRQQSPLELYHCHYLSGATSAFHHSKCMHAPSPPCQLIKQETVLMEQLLRSPNSTLNIPPLNSPPDPFVFWGLKGLYTFSKYRGETLGDVWAATFLLSCLVDLFEAISGQDWYVTFIHIILKIYPSSTSKTESEPIGSPQIPTPTAPTHATKTFPCPLYLP